MRPCYLPLQVVTSRACLMLLTLMAAACSPSAQTPCTYHDDCATPREYCSAQTNLCTLYECIEDANCKKNQRCNLILNSCELIPVPDMTLPDMPPTPDMPVDMRRDPDTGSPDMPPDLITVPDMMRPEEDLSPPVDMRPPTPDMGDRTPPSILALSPVEGSSITREDASWRVTFDEPLDSRSVSPFTVKLTNAERGELNVDVSLDPTGEEILVTLAMDEPFAPSESYTLSISEQVRDTAFNNLGRREQALYFPATARDEDNHALAMRWAPVIYQEIFDTSADNWRQDLPTRLDADQDFSAANNPSSLAAIPAASYRAAGYYHVAQTPSHHFITYIYYYPSRRLNDPTASAPTSLAAHDFTGVLLVVERGTDELLIAEGLRVEESYDVLISFTNADRAAEVSLPGEGRITGTFSPAMIDSGAQEGRYPLYVPAGRHEACYWYEPQVRPPYDVCVHPDQAFRDGKQGVLLAPSDTGMTYGEATPASDAAAPYAATMTYELLPFDAIFWHKRSLVGADLLFDRRRSYTPDGGRPSQRPDGSSILIPQSLSHEQNMEVSYGKTPYSWLTQPARSNRGQWLIDPAWTIPQRYYVPQTPAWSYEYCYNLTLGLDARQTAACQTSSPTP